MKGLIKKDFAILKIQKRFFFIIFAIGIMFLFSNTEESSIGASSYIIMLTALFSLGTLSYDEFENGMPFLLTLPFTRKDYVKEKFVFSFIGTAFTAALFLILAILTIHFHNSSECISDLLITTITVYMIACLLIAIIIPIQLKYGTEKKQIVLASTFLIVFAVLFVGKFLIEKFGLQENLSNFTTTYINDKIVFLSIIMITGILIAILYKVSVHIIEKKEY